jgi:hypothetical protein
MSDKERLVALIKKIQGEHPHDNHKEIAERVAKIVKNDDGLMEALAQSIFDGLYDEDVREGRTIPDHLRKPS